MSLKPKAIGTQEMLRQLKECLAHPLNAWVELQPTQYRNQFWTLRSP
ncbi:MAG: hypothetical protein WCA27_14415 [Candidatus Sulfotelmatobacter sp.]